MIKEIKAGLVKGPVTVSSNFVRLGRKGEVIKPIPPPMPPKEPVDPQAEAKQRKKGRKNNEAD